jgi:hypothetical protein
MDNNNKLLGGVTPLKKRQGNRGGKAAGAATATGKRRGGFAKASGGSGGRNVAGYNVNTRFKAEPWQAPPGSSSAPAPKPAVVVDKKTGNVITNNYGGNTTNNNTTNNNTETNTNEANVNTGPQYEDVWVEGTEATTKTETTPPGSRPSYAKAWDNMEGDGSGGKKNKYGKVFLTFEDFEKEAKQWNKDNPGYKTEGSTKTTTIPGKPGYYEKRLKNTGTGNVTINLENKSGGIKNGPTFTMRAHPFYRNYGIGGEPKKK